MQASGELDLCAAAPLSESLGDALAAGCLDFRVDLGSVTFIDASCLDVFLSLIRRLRLENGSLVFVSVSASVHRLFTLAGAGSLVDPTDARFGGPGRMLDPGASHA